MTKLTEAAVATLSAQERLSLIEVLWESLSDAETPLPEAQRAELERRLDSFEKDKGEAVTWQSIRAELRSRA